MAEREWPPPPQIKTLAKRVGKNPDDWWRNCHAASLAIVKSGLFPGSRVARGFCRAVPGAQHSWVVAEGTVYAPTLIIDPTLWSYVRTMSTYEVPRALFDQYQPHGAGDIWQAGKPRNTEDTLEEEIEVEGWAELSVSAQTFLELCGPLGLTGWRDLFHGPMQGWPSGEIIAAAYRDERLGIHIPIDVVGHVTDINPNGLYLPGEERE